MLDNLDNYEAGAITQDNSEATLAPAITKSIALIDFRLQAFYSCCYDLTFLKLLLIKDIRIVNVAIPSISGYGKSRKLYK